MKGRIDVKNLWKRNQIMITALALMIVIAGYLNFTGKEISDEVAVTNSAQFEEVGTGNAMSDLTDASATEMDETAGIYDISDEDLSTYEEIGSLDSDPTNEGVDFLDEIQSAEQASGLEQISDEILYVTDSAVGESADLGETNTAAIEDSETAKSSMVDDVPGEAVFTSATGVSALESANLLKEQTRAKNKETLLEIINSTTVSEESKQVAVNSMIELTDLAEKECATEILLEAKGFADVVVSISGESVDVMVGMSELSDAQRAQIEDIVARKTGVKPENIIISPIVEN